MKFQIEVGVKDGADVWWEPYDQEECHDEASIKAWATATIQRFNATLRDGEVARRFVGGVKIEGEGTRKHRWSKRNIMTQADHRGSFDNVYCTVCGATARRYELTRIKMQKPYTAKKWKFCPGAARDGDKHA